MRSVNHLVKRIVLGAKVKIFNFDKVVILRLKILYG